MAAYSDTQQEPEPLIVITTVASFADKKRQINQRLEPIRILQQNGRVHKVQQIRKCHEEPVGHGHKQIHITLKTSEDRYMDIVFDTRKVGWYLVYEGAGITVE